MLEILSKVKATPTYSVDKPMVFAHGLDTLSEQRGISTYFDRLTDITTYLP